MYIRCTYGSCGTDLGRSIAEITDNFHAIDVVTPVYEHSTFPLSATAVQSKGHIRLRTNSQPKRRCHKNVIHKHI